MAVGAWSGKGVSLMVPTILCYLTVSKDVSLWPVWRDLVAAPAWANARVTLVKFSAVRIFCITLTLLSGSRALLHLMGDATMSSAT